MDTLAVGLILTCNRKRRRKKTTLITAQTHLGQCGEDCWNMCFSSIKIRSGPASCCKKPTKPNPPATANNQTKTNKCTTSRTGESNSNLHIEISDISAC